MRNALIVTLLLGQVGLSGCLDFGPQPDFCSSGDCNYRFYNDSNLRVWEAEPEPGAEPVPYGVAVEAGGQRVFEFEYVYDDEPDIADDELTEFLRFEIPMDQDSFELSTAEELQNAVAFFQRSCYCPPPLAYAVSGTITGERINASTFEVSVDVTFDDGFNESDALRFQRSFRRSDLDD